MKQPNPHQVTSCESTGQPHEDTVKTEAESARDYRKSLKSQGKKAVNIHLSEQAKALLTRICTAKKMTMADAVEWSLNQAVKLEAIELANGPSSIPGQFQKGIREKLVAARTAAGLSIRDMADRIGIPSGRYDKWEHGLEKVPEKYLRAIIEMLDLPQSFFKDHMT
jgi:DNA-binding transcriptional regulator YiaG